jgi:hypothetical protein
LVRVHHLSPFWLVGLKFVFSPKTRKTCEIFAQPRFTAPHELFDPSMGLLTKSQKLGPAASNSLQFAHQGGPFALPGWVPKKVHNGRLKWLCKALPASTH